MEMFWVESLTHLVVEVQKVSERTMVMEDCNLRNTEILDFNTSDITCKNSSPLNSYFYW